MNVNAVLVLGWYRGKEDTAEYFDIWVSKWNTYNGENERSLLGDQKIIISFLCIN